MTIAVKRSEFNRIVRESQKHLPKEDRISVSNMNIFVPAHFNKNPCTGVSDLHYVQELIYPSDDIPDDE